MGDYIDMLHEAKQSLGQAKQMVEFTYPLVREQRLLLPVIEHIVAVFKSCIVAVLYFEKVSKRVGDAFSLQYHTFRTRFAPSYGVLPLLASFDEAREILLQHEVSDVEFVRGDSLLLFSDNFSTLKSLDVLLVKKYLSCAYAFFTSICERLGGVSLL